MIDGVCHLYSDGVVFTVRDNNGLYATAGWFFNLHRGSLSSSSIWETTEFNLPFLGSALPSICFFPIWHMLIDGLVCYRDQWLLTVAMIMQPLAPAIISPAHERDPLDETGEIFFFFNSSHTRPRP